MVIYSGVVGCRKGRLQAFANLHALSSVAVLGMKFELQECAEEFLVVRVHVAEKRGTKGEGGRGRGDCGVCVLMSAWPQSYGP